MAKVKELIDRLPGSWAEFKLSDFIKVTQVEIKESDEFGGLFVGIDNTLAIISAITGVSIEELSEMPKKDVDMLAKKIEFITTDCPKDKITIKWKKVDELSYDAYVTLVTMGNDMKNLPTIIKALSENKFSDEVINNLSMQEAYSAFFTLSKSAKKSLSGLIRSLGLKVARLTIREERSRLFRKLKRRKPSK